MRVFHLCLLFTGLLAAATSPVIAADFPEQPPGPYPGQSPIDIIPPPAGATKLPRLDFGGYPKTVNTKMVNELVKVSTPVNNNPNWPSNPYKPLDNNKTLPNGDPNPNYNPSRLTHPRHAPWLPGGMTETDFELKIKPLAGAKLKIGDDTYSLANIHFHQHSEHTLNGNSRPMEMHMVHTHDVSGEFLAVGRWLVVGPNDNKTLAKVFTHPPRLPDEPPAAPHEVAINNFRLRSLLPKSTYLNYRYDGSLTTGSPISKDEVSWVFFHEPLEVSQAQVDAFRNGNYFPRGTVRKVWAPGEFYVTGPGSQDYYYHSLPNLETGVPEPSTVWLLAIAGLMVGRRARR